MYLYFKWDMVLNIMLKLTNKGFVLADSIIGLIIICSGILILLTNYQSLNNQENLKIEDKERMHLLLNRVRSMDKNELVNFKQIQVSYENKVETLSKEWIYIIRNNNSNRNYLFNMYDDIFYTPNSVENQCK